MTERAHRREEGARRKKHAPSLQMFLKVADTPGCVPRGQNLVTRLHLGARETGKFYLFVYLAVLGLSCGMWDLVS